MATRTVPSSNATRPQEQTPHPIPDPTPAVPKPKRRRACVQGGCIVHRKDSFYAVFRTPEGKQKWVTFHTRADARKHLTDSVQKIGAGTFVDALPELFETYADVWLARRRQTVKPGTSATYRSIIQKRLKPRFQGKEMREITSVDVRLFLDHLLQKTRLSAKSIGMAMKLLRDIFGEAIDDRVAAANPVRLKKGDVPANPKAKYMPPAADVLATLQELDVQPALQALVATAAMTGLRRGELLGLLWECVDPHAGTIRVERSLCRALLADKDKYSRINIEWQWSETLALVDPKTKRSRRIVVMPQELNDLLRNLRARTRTASPYVFQKNETGAPFDPDTMYDDLHAAQDRAGVRRFRLHVVRHLYASELHQAGAPPAHSRDRLGHSTIGMTSHYTHDLADGHALAEKVALAFPLAVRQLLDVRARPS